MCRYITCALVDSMVSNWVDMPGTPTKGQGTARRPRRYGVDMPGTQINVRVQPGGPSELASVFGLILVGSGGQLLRR